MGPAGTQMPCQVHDGQLDNHCGTDAGGWLQGMHPVEYGVEVTMTICFDGGHPGVCNYRVEATVTRCPNGDSGFYVYHLETVPLCTLRYCGATPTITTPTPTIPTTNVTETPTASTITTTESLNIMTTTVTESTAPKEKCKIFISIFQLKSLNKILMKKYSFILTLQFL